jgi:hypothetical protein
VGHGKDAQDWSDLVVHAPSLYIQEGGLKFEMQRIAIRAGAPAQCRQPEPASQAQLGRCEVNLELHGGGQLSAPCGGTPACASWRFADHRGLTSCTS